MERSAETISNLPEQVEEVEHIRRAALGAPVELQVSVHCKFVRRGCGTGVSIVQGRLVRRGVNLEEEK